jgi:hypothetical protein
VEAAPTHPDSRTLVEFQEYMQRVVPRVFRSALENSLDNEIQPLEERQMSQITSILRESQDQAFSLYRTQMASTPSTPITSISTDEFSAPFSALVGGRQMAESSYSTTTEEGSSGWTTSPHCHDDNILGINLDANSVSTQEPRSHEEDLLSWSLPPEFVPTFEYFPFDGPDTNDNINTLNFPF